MGEINKTRLHALLGWGASLATASLVLLVVIMPSGANDSVRFFAVGFLLFGCILCIFPLFSAQRKNGRLQGESSGNSRVLMDQGLYSIVRHPQYIGFILFSIGFALMLQNRIGYFLAAISGVLFELVSIFEEDLCEESFGDLYREYKQRVPRFNLLVGLLRKIMLRKQY